MKIRANFVSNSSSTSFTFCFKGEIDDLHRKIIDYQNYFYLAYDGYNWGSGSDYVFKCNALEVANAIQESYESKPIREWEEVKIENIDKLIADEKKALSAFLEEIDDVKRDSWMRKYDEETIKEMNDKIKKLERSKGKGLDKVLVIDFGDNHGVISGGDLGNAMDYEGRYIKIDEDDFVVFTEQNR